MKTFVTILLSSLLATTASLHTKRSLQADDDIIARTIDIFLPNLNSDQRTVVKDTLTDCTETSIGFSDDYTKVLDTLEACTNTSLTRASQLSCITHQQSLFDSLFSIDFLMDPGFNSTDMTTIKDCADEKDSDTLADATGLVLQRFTPCTLNITSDLTAIFKEEIDDDNTMTKFLVSSTCAQMQSFQDFSSLASDTIFPALKRLVNTITRGNRQ